jgi:hypothetical protein
LLLYYVGHGGFGESDAFFLSIRSTEESDPLATSITAESLGRLIREHASGLRNYLLLDCCFAASVTKVFMTGGPLGVAGAQLRDVLPPQGDATAFEAGRLPKYGTALLCASGPREPAKAPADLPYTMFTGGLLEVLRSGDPSAPDWLSLDDIQRQVRTRLETQFADKAVLPQLHSPQQRMGRLDLVPLFRNPAYRPEEPVPARPVQSTAVPEIVIPKVISKFGPKVDTPTTRDPTPETPSSELVSRHDKRGRNVLWIGPILVTSVSILSLIYFYGHPMTAPTSRRATDPVEKANNLTNNASTSQTEDSKQGFKPPLPPGSALGSQPTSPPAMANSNPTPANTCPDNSGLFVGGAATVQGHKSSGTQSSILGFWAASAREVQGAGVEGIVVTRVDPGGWAGKALKTGDIILDANGESVSALPALDETVRQARAAGKLVVLLRVKTGAKTGYRTMPTLAPN